MALPVMTIDGDVVAVHSHWTSDGSRIVTEATVRTPDGTDVVVSQLGGTVDGIGMISMPGPAPLVVGMSVAVAAHRDLDLAQHEHIVLDSVKVFAYPPSYVQTGPTNSDKYLYWESGCVFVTLDDAGTTAIAGDQEFPLIQASIDEWNNKTAACSYLNVVNEGRKALEVGNDKVNLIKFRDTTWGRPAIADDPARDYNNSAAGITTAVYVNDAKSARDGAIVDADVELNGVNFSIAVCDDQMRCTSLGHGAFGFADLQNTLTHELGHLHGLEHPCLAGMDPQRLDHSGNAVPTCDEVQRNPSLPANMAILDATMFNFQVGGEIKKRSLSQDEIQSMCELYPIAKDPGTCDHVGKTSTGGCCSASGRPDVSLLLAGTTVLIMLRRRKTSPTA